MKHLILSLFLSFQTIAFLQTETSSNFEILKNLELLELVYKNIDLYYVDESNPGELMRTGIDAMLAELDPYTNYIPESRMEDYKLMTTGQYGGIGAIIRQIDDKVLVVDPIEKFPAQKAGVIAGDIFIEIDGKNVESLSSPEISEKLKGQPGSEVKIKILRQGSQKDFTLIREEVKSSPVPYYGKVDNKTGYIKLTSFTQTSAKDVFNALVDLISKQSITQLVFDLRGNGGGLLQQAVQMVNFFVEKGSNIVEIKGRMEGVNSSFTAKAKPVDLKIPLVVLIDGGSASASEIVSGALQDLDRAVILGKTSFGKGLVQRPLDLKYNAKLKVTIAKYYTPSGRCIQKLNYTTKKLGENAEAVSNESITSFKTKNGRPVIDGRGVEPDVLIKEDTYSRLTATLIIENIIFDFATKYQVKNESIGDINSFHLTDEDYNNFKNYALSQVFEYSTISSEIMKTLKEEAEKEGLYADSENIYNQLFEQYKPSKERDLEKFRKEIIDLLEDEIVGRYYYQTGRIQHALISDRYILEAIEILNDQARYNSILNIQN